MKHTYAVIMSGGVGSRFWPKSRQNLPKQYLNLFGSSTLIQGVGQRLQLLLPNDRIYVVSTQSQYPLLQKQLDWLPPSHLILEPFGKNTAPCIGLAAIHLQNADPDAIMIVLPADHLISDAGKFVQVLDDAVALIRKHPNALMTIGIEPTYPATGYGYIQRGEPLQENGIRAFRVRAFAEKPTFEVAQQFFSTGEFLWNSGIFIWRADTILHYIEDLMPDLFVGLKEIRQSLDTPSYPKVLERVYKQIYSESIDYGIMEHASDVIVLEGQFGWSDVGSWEEVYNLSEKDADGNVIIGDPIIKDVSNCFIEAERRVVAVIGLKDFIVIDTEDALLICQRSQCQEVKWVVEKLKHTGQHKVL